MKTLLTISFLLISLNIQCQNWALGLKVNQFNGNTGASSSLGAGFSISLNNLYTDISSNFVSGKGDYLEFNSSYTYKLEKVSFLVWNIGYIIRFKNIGFIPLIGYGTKGNVYQDPLLWDTYYIERKPQFNIGGLGSLYIGHVGIQFGYGIFDGLQGGLTYKW